MDARTELDLAEAYHRTLLVLFRLLFLAYAEDRGLLPVRPQPPLRPARRQDARP